MSELELWISPSSHRVRVSYLLVWVAEQVARLVRSLWVGVNVSGAASVFCHHVVRSRFGFFDEREPTGLAGT
jgi:hypothetical protein